jgi:hypothetical protein
MGGGAWSAKSYDLGTARKISTGSTFGYDRVVRSTGIRKAHESLDPKGKNLAGLQIRESRDSVEHPNSVPICVGLDVTGSMASTPRTVQQKLTGLFGLLVRKGYVEDPQIMVSAYGDAYTDSVPLQISQFESDNRTDDNLDNLFLEGNGGGNRGETQTLLWYYLNNHVVTDAWEKRGKKGYLFVIADEKALDLEPKHVKEFIGVEETVGEHELTAEYLATEVKKKWEVIILLVDNMSAKAQRSEEFYTKLFGRNNVLILESADTISETIGAALGVLENEDIDDNELEADLLDEGATTAIAGNTVKAVARLNRNGGGKAVRAQGNVSLDVEDDDLNIR